MSTYSFRAYVQLHFELKYGLVLKLYVLPNICGISFKRKTKVQPK